MYPIFEASVLKTHQGLGAKSLKYRVVGRFGKRNQHFSDQVLGIAGNRSVAGLQ